VGQRERRKLPPARSGACRAQAETILHVVLSGRQYSTPLIVMFVVTQWLRYGQDRIVEKKLQYPQDGTLIILEAMLPSRRRETVLQL